MRSKLCLMFLWAFRRQWEEEKAIPTHLIHFSSSDSVCDRRMSALMTVLFPGKWTFRSKAGRNHSSNRQSPQPRPRGERAQWKACVPLRSACHGPPVMWDARCVIRLPLRPSCRTERSQPPPVADGRIALTAPGCYLTLTFLDQSIPHHWQQQGLIQPSRNSRSPECTDVAPLACARHLFRCHYRKSIYMSNCLLIHFIIKSTVAIRDIYILIRSSHAWEWRSCAFCNANQPSEKVLTPTNTKVHRSLNIKHSNVTHSS